MLHEIDDVNLPIDMGIELIPKGKLDYIDFDKDNLNPLI
jgi:hypothetical protein